MKKIFYLCIGLLFMVIGFTASTLYAQSNFSDGAVIGPIGSNLSDASSTAGLGSTGAAASQSAGAPGPDDDDDSDDDDQKDGDGGTGEAGSESAQ